MRSHIDPTTTGLGPTSSGITSCSTPTGGPKGAQLPADVLHDGPERARLNRASQQGGDEEGHYQEKQIQTKEDEKASADAIDDACPCPPQPHGSSEETDRSAGEDKPTASAPGSAPRGTRRTAAPLDESVDRRSDSTAWLVVRKTPMPGVRARNRTWESD